MLRVGVVLIVLIFKSSGALAAAYGIAVTGVMVIDTFNASLVARSNGAGRPDWCHLLFGALGITDLLFLPPTRLKIPEGGWLPLVIAAAMFLVMETWRRGRRAHMENVRSESMPLQLFLERADKTPMRVAGLGVFLSSRTDVVPGALLHNLKHNKVLHERVVLANVVVEDTPVVPAEKRIEVEKLGKGFYAVRIHHGFFETPDVPQAMEDARRSAWPSTSRPRPSSSAARRWCPPNIPRWAAGATGSIAPWPPTRCRPRDSITCRPIGWSSWAPRSRSDIGLRTRPPHTPSFPTRTRPDPGRAGRGVRRHRHQPALRHARVRAGGGRPRRPRFAVYGALSLIFWALVMVVTVKYVVFIMRADNNGEGGVLALAALAHRAPVSRTAKTAIGIAALLGLALFYGDGMLTPAISVLSALEGLGVGMRKPSALDHAAHPRHPGRAVLLQSTAPKHRQNVRAGDGAVVHRHRGAGRRRHRQAPQILRAADPRYGLALFVHEPWTAFVALGSVVLAVTGCEALYADMGHFGAVPFAGPGCISPCRPCC